MNRITLVFALFAIAISSCSKPPKEQLPEKACYECKTITETANVDPMIVTETVCDITEEQARAREQSVRRHDSIAREMGYSVYMICAKK